MSEPLYSVICQHKKGYVEETVATGLSFAEAKALAIRLDQQVRERTEASGKHYSSWTADIHYVQREAEVAA